MPPRSGRGGCPGSRRGPGKFPGPSLIPALNAIQARLGWLPREELEELAREHAAAALRDRGPDLVLPALPHRRRRPRSRCTSATTCPASCATARPGIAELRRTVRRGRRRRAGRGLVPGPLRHRPGRGGQRASRPGDPMWTRSSSTPAPTGSGEAAAQTPRRSPGPTTRTRPGRVSASGTRSLRALLAGDLDAGRRSSRPQGLRPARHGRRRLPHRAEVGAGPRGTAGAAKYAICNADESEPGTFKDRQILADPAAPRAGGPAARHGRGRRRAGLGLHPPRVRARGARAARRDRGPARRRGRRARRVRTRLESSLRLARRLHPRRGDRAAGVHGGPPRRAAEQAPVPRQLRPARPPDADQLRRDVRRRAGDRAARRAVVGRSGRRRVGRLEVLRRLRPRRATRRRTASRWARPSAS